MDEPSRALSSAAKRAVPGEQPRELFVLVVHPIGDPRLSPSSTTNYHRRRGRGSTMERGRDIYPQRCCAGESWTGNHSAALLVSPRFSGRASAELSLPLVLHGGRVGGLDEFSLGTSNKFLLAMVATAVAIDAALTTLVLHQQHNQSTINGPVSRPPATPVPAAPSPASAAAVPPLTPAPQATTPLAPALVVWAPRIITPPQRATTKILPRWRIHPIPASPPPPQTNPTNSASSHTPVKPGAPPEISNPDTSAKSDTPVKPSAPPAIS